MSIFDIFKFKTDFKEVFNVTNISFIKNLINEEIKKQIKKNIPGQEKMDNVVNTITVVIRTRLSSNNKIVQWIVENILIKNIRLVCQSIYDDLKELVKGL